MQVIAYPALRLLWKGCLTSALYFHKKPLAGFSRHASPHGANARQAGRQIRRSVKTDSQTDAGKNPWLWSRKQCQMLLVMWTYNHFVRHVSPRASKYILYTRARRRSGMEPNLSMCARAHQVIIIAQRGILEAMSTVNTRTHTQTPTHASSHPTLTPHIHALRLHILHGGFDSGHKVTS